MRPMDNIKDFPFASWFARRRACSTAGGALTP
jgi:hypothetical protein